MEIKDFAYNFIAVAILSGLCAGARYLFVGPDQSYVVTGKADNKITYRAVSNPHDVYTMNFDADTGYMAPGFYPYINVGDTIIGPSRQMELPIARSQSAVIRPQMTTYVINRVNGKTLDDLLKQDSKRNNLIRKIIQKQK